MISVRTKDYSAEELEILQQAIIIGMNGIPCKSIDCHCGLSDCPNCEHKKVCKDLVDLVHFIATLSQDREKYDCLIVVTDDYDSDNPVEYCHNSSLKINIKAD